MHADRSRGDINNLERATDGLRRLMVERRALGGQA